jgi:hypothetical protein
MALTQSIDLPEDSNSVQGQLMGLGAGQYECCAVYTPPHQGNGRATYGPENLPTQSKNLVSNGPRSKQEMGTGLRIIVLG